MLFMVFLPACCKVLFSVTILFYNFYFCFSFITTATKIKFMSSTVIDNKVEKITEDVGVGSLGACDDRSPFIRVTWAHLFMNAPVTLITQKVCVLLLLLL